MSQSLSSVWNVSVFRRDTSQTGKGVKGRGRGGRERREDGLERGKRGWEGGNGETGKRGNGETGKREKERDLGDPMASPLGKPQYKILAPDISSQIPRLSQDS
jgi:hypothetical protein